MMENICVQITDKPLNIETACDFVDNGGAGATNLFVGRVRNNHEGNDVTGITYDIHDNLAKKALSDICTEAEGLWPETRYYVAHYKGELPVGGISVIIAVSAPHRAETFEACRYVIEELKLRAPVWKQEHYTDGKSDWLPGHSLKEDAAADSICCGKCS
ncbi:MAG: molybdenum cofactor biosynthesis protein MoaE [Pseudomonadota bacterium]|jgi:molybdopterin synthase catalytic subunit|nr:molybdenum cofactor biosynthesis protein MoaE [Pseudomonadota bacterium]QKK06193.1 MAG: molybdenum cofactor biosynthesis protein MoaE [Pseudomonadota bacterium]